jgi:hypothetical protein
MGRGRSKLATVAALTAIFFAGVGAAYAVIHAGQEYQGTLPSDPKAQVTVDVDTVPTFLYVFYNDVKMHCPDPADSDRESFFDHIAIQPDHTFTNKREISGGKLVSEGEISGKKVTGTMKAAFDTGCVSHPQSFVANALP